MPEDLANYIASRYLVSDSKQPAKRRKKKSSRHDNGLVIRDEDEDTWGLVGDNKDNADEFGPVAVAGGTADFRKSKKSNWKAVDGSEKRAKHDDQAAADAILASAAAENDPKGMADDEMPVIEEGDGVAKMSDGTHAGLQSATAVAAQLKRRQQDEREEFERHRNNQKEEETVYRDATGRRIDVSMKRAEARRAAAEAEKKERLAKESLKGEVQLEEARMRREKLENAKLMTFSRKADDLEMNEELKDQERWNDPMRQFITKTGREKKKGPNSKSRPLYNGAPPPNRYGIKPGYRWDGVDRGIGFEAERFRALNRRDRLKGLDYSWQMDE